MYLYLFQNICAEFYFYSLHTASFFFIFLLLVDLHLMASVSRPNFLTAAQVIHSRVTLLLEYLSLTEFCPYTLVKFGGNCLVTGRYHEPSISGMVIHIDNSCRMSVLVVVSHTATYWIKSVPPGTVWLSIGSIHLGSCLFLMFLAHAIYGATYHHSYMDK